MISCALDERTASASNGKSKLLDQWMKSHANGMPISSNQPSLSLPFQRWFKLKEAFSPQFIIDCVENAGREVKDCLDPFGGSGTSALTCQFLGIKPTTIEVNPFLADLIEAKLATYDIPALKEDFEDVLAIADPRGIRPRLILRDAPPTMVQPGSGSRWVFSTQAAQKILALSAAIDAVQNSKNRRLLRVVLGSILIGASNIVVNGKGRRYRRNWQDRKRTADMVERAFRQNFDDVVADLSKFNARAGAGYRVIRGDCRKRISDVELVDVAVFSPPYPNSFDYTDIYNLELWMLGYFNSKKDNSILRNRTFRSHVQIKRSFDTLRGASHSLDRVYDKLALQRDQLWNRNIPEMVSSYFCDLVTILLDVHSKLRANGRIFIAVGSSKYAGVFVDVPKITVELATCVGLRLVDSAAIRSMRSSAQQGGRKELRESMLVFC